MPPAPPTTGGDRATSAPRRICVGCRRQRDKHDLLRLARTPQGVRFDPEQRFPGRGAYVCPDPACIASAAQRDARSVRRALRGAPTDEVRTAVDELRTVIDGDAGTEPREHHKEQNA